MSTAGSQYREFREVVCLLLSEAERRVLCLGLATALVVVGGSALAALSPLVLKSLVDGVAASSQAGALAPRPSALVHGMGYVLLLLAGRVLADIRPLLNGAIDRRLHSRLTRRFFDHVLRLPMGYLLKHRAGGLQHRLDLASAGAQLMVGHLTGSVLPTAVELVTMAGVLIHLGQPGLVLVFGMAALAYLAIFSSGAHAMSETAHDVSKSSLETHAQVGEGLAHLETLRCFSAEAHARQRLDRASDLLEQRWTRLNRLNAVIALARQASSRSRW